MSHMNMDLKRIGWEEAFKEMMSNGDDELVMPDVFADEILMNGIAR